MPQFFDTGARRRNMIYRQQALAILFTAYLVISLQVLMAALLTLELLSPLAILSYIMLVPIIPVFTMIYFTARSSGMGTIEYLNYAINLRSL